MGNCTSYESSKVGKSRKKQSKSASRDDKHRDDREEGEEHRDDRKKSDKHTDDRKKSDKHTDDRKKSEKSISRASSIRKSVSFRAENQIREIESRRDLQDLEPSEESKQVEASIVASPIVASPLVALPAASQVNKGMVDEKTVLKNMVALNRTKKLLQRASSMTPIVAIPVVQASPVISVQTLSSVNSQDESKVADARRDESKVADARRDESKVADARRDESKSKQEKKSKRKEAKSKHKQSFSLRMLHRRRKRSSSSSSSSSRSSSSSVSSDSSNEKERPAKETNKDKVNVYAHIVQETQQQNQESNTLVTESISTIGTRGIPLDTWKRLKACETMASRVNTFALAFIQGICSDGSIRLVLEQENVSRLASLDDISFPNPASSDLEERRAATNCLVLMEHILLQRLVLVHIRKYQPTTDRILVKLYMPDEPLQLTIGTNKMIDVLTRTMPENTSIVLPSRYPTALVAPHWVNVNAWLLQVKGCFIVMDNRKVDWFARISDWRRYQALVSSIK